MLGVITTCNAMKTKTGVRVRRVDFSDPQGGKGACGRKAASIKAHVRRHINKGHDVQIPKDFRDAKLSNGGLNGVRVALVKLAGVTSLNSFQYSEQGITVWRAFLVGQGKLINQSQIEGTYCIHVSHKQCSLYN